MDLVGHIALASSLVLLSAESVQAQPNRPFEAEASVGVEPMHDSSARLLEEISQDWDGLEWLNDNRTEYVFDESGNRLGELRQSWDGLTWVNLSGSRHTRELDSLGRDWAVTEEWTEASWILASRLLWIYDEQGHHIERIYQEWSDDHWLNWYRDLWEWDGELQVRSTTQVWDGARWVDNERTFTTFDERGNRIEYFSLLWDGQMWNNESRLLYAHDDRDNQTERIFQVGDGSEWVNQDRGLNSYDAAGNLTEEVDLVWINGAWRNHEKHVYVYNESGKMIEWEEYFYFGHSTDWEPNWRDIYQHDEQGRYLGRIGHTWGESDWVKVLRSTKSRNDAGQEIETLHEDWTGTDWVFTSRFRIAYDDSGNPVQYLWGNWDGSEFVNRHRRLKKYDTGITSGIGGPVPLPDHNDGVKLHPNYPNPFASSTTISFELSRAAKVNVTILDPLGRVVQVLVDSDREAGKQEIQWRPSQLGSGLYIVRLAADGVVATRSILLVE